MPFETYEPDATLSPAKRVEAAIDHASEAEVAALAIALLRGENVGETFLLVVGGEHARGILGGAPPLYWPEVWGARALLTAWSDDAQAAVVAGLGNQAWRVREMCARVVAERGLAVAESIEPLLRDDTARVRAAAARALGEVGDASHEQGIRELLKDPDIELRRAAGAALKRLTARVGASPQ